MGAKRRIKRQTSIMDIHTDLLNLSSEAIYAWDLYGTIIYWNNGAEKIYGYSSKEAVGCVSHELLKTEQIKVDDIILVLIKDGVWNGEIANTCKNGKKLIVETTQKLITNNLGQRIVLEISRDVTEFKKIENNLKETNNRLALELTATKDLHSISTRPVHKGNIFEALNEIIKSVVIITNADMGNIQLFDSQSNTLKIVAQYGFKKPFLDYFNNVSKCQAACGTVMAQRKRIICEDVTTNPIFVDSPDLPVMLSANARAVQSTPLYNHAGDLLGILSTHYNTPHIPDERELMLIDMLTRVIIDDIMQEQNIINKGLLVQSEKDNDALIKDNSALIQHNDDLIKDKAGLVKDNDALVKDKAGLAKDNDDLVKDKAALIKDKDSLEKDLVLKDEFLSLISHEFKTPLTVINSAIQAMESLCKDELSPRAKGYIKNIRQNANRQLRLVNNLLDITKLSAGRMKINKINSDIVFLAKSITESVYMYASQKGISLTFTSSINKKIIGIDEEKLERILLNLLSNAIKFTPSGSVF